MTVRVDSPDQIVAAVVAAYPVGRVIAFERLHQGRDNETFRIATPEGEFVLRRISSRNHLEAVQYRHRLLGQALADNLFLQSRQREMGGRVQG